MAVAYVNAGTLTSVGQPAVSITPPLPASINAGDLLVVSVCQYAGSGGFTWPAGWTQVDQQAWVPGGTNFFAGFAYRIATGTDSAPAVTWTGAGNAIAQVFKFTGADSTPFSAARSFATGAASGTHTSAAITTTANNSDVIYLDMSYGATLLTNPAGWTSDANAAGTLLEIALGDKQITTSGTSSGGISTAGNSAVGWIQWQQEILTPQPKIIVSAPVPTIVSGSLDIILSAPAPIGISGPDLAVFAPAPIFNAGIILFNYGWADGLLAATPVLFVESIGIIVSAPPPAFASDFGPGALLVAPSPTISAALLDTAYSAISAPAPQITATSEFWSAGLSAATPTLDASIPGGLVVTAPVPTLAMQSYFSGFAGSAPAPTVFLGFDGGMILVAPAPQIFSVLFHPTDVSTPENPYAIPFPAWAINYETNAPSRYDSLPANSMCIFNGKTYMACAAGIYEIGADDDAGRPIHASATVAQTNFGSTKNKRIAYVYVGMRSSGAMQLKAIANNQSDRYYALNAIGGAVRGSRADLGKGLEGQYWQFRVDNVNGADFELDSIEFKPAVLSRHGV